MASALFFILRGAAAWQPDIAHLRCILSPKTDQTTTMSLFAQLSWSRSKGVLRWIDDFHDTVSSEPWFINR